MPTSKTKKAYRLPRYASRGAGGRGEKIDLGILNRLIAVRLRYASGITNRLFGEEFAPRGYVPKQYSVAYLIARNSQIHLKSLAAALGVDPSTLIVTVDYLQSIGWVKRRRSEIDRRIVGLSITPKGRANLAEAETRMRRCDAWLSRVLSAQERDHLFALIERIEHAAETRLAEE